MQSPPNSFGPDIEQATTQRILFDRFRISKRVGEGATSTVYKATDIASSATVAVKVLHAKYVNESNVVRRFIREARAIDALRHEHIVQLIDAGQGSDGSPYLVFEYLEGVDLGTVIGRDGRLEPKRAAKVMLQVCKAIAAAHASNVLHRDLKPGNILLTRHGAEDDYVKVLDFGVSKFLNSAMSDITSRTDLVGTPLYMAPEQATDPSTVDHRADIYSLGTVFYHVLTGRVPVSAPNYAAFVEKLLDVTPPPPQTVFADIPDELGRIVMRAIEKDRDARFATVGELIAALEEFLGVRPAHAQPAAGGSAAVTRANDVEFTDTALGSIPAPTVPALSVRLRSQERRRPKYLALYVTVALSLLALAAYIVTALRA